MFKVGDRVMVNEDVPFSNFVGQVGVVTGIPCDSDSDLRIWFNEKYPNEPYDFHEVTNA